MKDLKQKALTEFVITVFAGWIGVHKFKQGKVGIGILYLFTFGLFYVGWIYDIIQSWKTYKYACRVQSQSGVAAPTPANVAPAPVQNTDTFTFKAAGVTFNNGRKTRQAILRKIYWRDEPFLRVSYTLREYDFNGSPAIGIYANGEQIGNVPKDDVSFVLPLLDKITKISVNVSGGGQTESGENINFGAAVTITYTK